MTSPDLDNRHLEDLMTRAFENEQKNHAFLEELFSSNVFILSQGSGQDGEQTLEADSQISIEQWTMEDGTLFIPVFTSVRELLEATTEEDSKYLELNAGALFEMVQGTDVVINPASKHAIRLDPEYMEGILDHFLNHDHDADVLLGQPQPEAVKALKKAVSDYFRTSKTVAYAALALMSQGDNDQSVVIGVSFGSKPIDEAVMNGIGQAASPHVPKNMGLDVLVLPEPPSTEGLEGYLQNEGDRFYTR